MTKLNIRQSTLVRVLSLLLVVCALFALVPPPSANAAGFPPALHVDPFYAENDTQYHSPFMGREVPLRDIPVSFSDGSADSYGFCYAVNKGLTGWTSGYRWKNGRSVDTEISAAAPFIAFYYNGLVNGDDGTPWSEWTREAVRGWVQVAIWAAQEGTLNDYNDPTQLQLVAEERLSVYERLFAGQADKIPSLTNSRAIIESIVAKYKANGYGTLTTQVYSYDDPAQNLQPILVAWLNSEPSDDYPVYVKLSKTIKDVAGYYAGATFGVFTDLACQDERGRFITTAEQWSVSNEILLPFESGTLYVKELDSGDSDIPVNGTAFPVTVDATIHNSAANAATVYGDGVNGSIVNTPGGGTPTGGVIQKIDAKTKVGLAGAVFNFAGNGINRDETTGVDGIIDLQWLDPTKPKYIPPGEYTVTEKLSPDTHEKTPEARHLRLWIEIINGDPVAKQSGPLIFENFRKHTVTLRKLSAGGAFVQGAVFEVYRDGTLLGTYTTDAAGMIKLGAVSSGYYKFLEVKAPAGAVLPYIPYTGIYIDATDTTNTDRYVTMTNYEYPEIVITKQCAVSSRWLAGAQFEVQIDATTIGTFTTDSTGRITINYEKYKDFLDGAASSWTVTVTELSPPDSYFAPKVLTQTNEIIKGQALSPFSFKNTPFPDVLAYKYDGKTSLPLAGAVFTLTGKDNANVFVEVSGADGIARFAKVPVGTYELRETIAPQHYIASSEIKTVVVREDGTPELRFEFSNLKKITLTLIKYDYETTQTLPNAEFSIAHKGGAVVHEGVTNAQGQIVIADLEPGWYTITELAPPEGWLIITPSRDVQLKAGEDLEVKIDNIPCPTLEINKLDKITRDGLSGVRFNVKFNSVNDFSGGVVDLGDFVTDANGKILLNNNQKSGWYRVTEIAPKSGYAPASPSYQDIFLAGGDDKVLTFENTPLSALIIHKTDLIGKPVQGAIFTVRYLGGTSGSGGTIIHTGVTSVNGTIVLTGLVAGTYVVEETKPADGMELSNPSVQTAYLSGLDQDVVQLAFENPRMGKLVITKLDSVTKKPLAGATFKVTDSSGGVIGASNGIYTTDASGVITIEDNLPVGSTVVVTEQKAPDGYILDGTPQSVKIKENTLHPLIFYNAPKSSAQIIKIDAVTKQPLKNAQFTVYKMNGERVGIFTTDGNGVIILPELAPGWYKAAESKAPVGYIIDDTPQDFEITSNQFVKLVFENVPVGDAQIIKLDEDTRKPIPGVQFTVAKMNGERVGGIYITDAAGLIRLPELDDGWYTAVEVKAADGYLLDATPRNFEVKDGKTAVLTVTNKKAAGVLLHKVDSITGKGIYGVQFLLSDAGNNPVGQYTSDQDGYVYIGFDEQLAYGKYFLRELRPAEGYIADDEIKTIYLEAGRTSQITWKNTAITAQIQVVKYLQDNNPITGAAAGSLLKGAVFEITQARSGAVVGYITTDARGVAASPPLPLGRYFVKEVTPAPYTQLNPERFEAELEYAGQIVRLAVYNKSATLSTEIKKVGNLQVIAGDSMRYDLSIKNASNVPLSEFFWADRIPTDAVRIQTLTTGTYNQRLYYRVVYKTNTGLWRTLASNLLTTNNYSFSLHANALGLANGEVVTDVKLEFGTVPAGFASVVKPTITVQTLATLAKGYIITNRAYVGGKYLDAPQESTTAWTTEVVRYDKPQPSLPKTGY